MTPESILSSYFSKQHITYTSKHLTESLQFHPHYPSVISIVDILTDYRVDNMAVHIDPEQLIDVEFPAIAHVQEADQEGYILLEGINDGQISYRTPQNVTESLTDFYQKWTGVLVLLAPTPQAGEENYSISIKKSKGKQWEKIAGFTGLALIGLTALGTSLNHSAVGLSLVALFGFIVSVFLVMKEFGSSNSFIEKICKINDQVNCQAILASKGAKIGGWFSWAEVGFVYFAGQLFALFFQSSTSFELLFVISLLALPYVLFSVYYQGVILKQWCALCLGIQGVLILQSLYLGLLNDWTIDWMAVITSFSELKWFLLPFSIWLLVKGFIQSAQKLPQVTKELMAFKRDHSLFRNTLERNATIDCTAFEEELILGGVEAPILLTMVSNPNCNPCAFAHEQVEKLLARYPDVLKVQIRFVGNPAISHNLLGISDPKRFMEGLKIWYQSRDLEKWKNWIGAIDSERGKKLVIAQNHWANTIAIQHTPTFFINGQRLAAPFVLDNIKYHLKELCPEAETAATHEKN
jgi:uncharacterized membrane protein